jgi:hypothetical protein
VDRLIDRIDLIERPDQESRGGNMQVTAMTLACGLATLFISSAFAKVTYWDETLGWFAELFPHARPRLVGGAVVVAEVVIALAIVAAPRSGAIAAAGWLLVASAVLVSARRRVASCGCFGLRQQLGVRVAIRNCTSITVAGATAATAGSAAAATLELLPFAAVAGVTVVVLREAMQRKGVVV